LFDLYGIINLKNVVMKKRIEPTLVEKAIEAVPGFEQVFKKLEQQVILRGQSQSTLNNYIRCIANISLHFLRLPEQISDDEINEYLTALALNPKSPSRSNFKHAVYGLLNIVTLKGLLGHAEITTTMI
jgi:site-specific recombinase XerD